MCERQPHVYQTSAAPLCCTRKNSIPVQKVVCANQLGDIAHPFERFPCMLRPMDTQNDQEIFWSQSLYRLVRKRNSRSVLPELRTIQLKHKVLVCHHPLEINAKECALLDKHMIRPFLASPLTGIRGRIFLLIAQGQ